MNRNFLIKLKTYINFTISYFLELDFLIFSTYFLSVSLPL